MFQPVLARTATAHRPVGPIAYDCVQLSFVRAGSARWFSEFGQQRVREGDAVLLCPNTLWGSEPNDWITTTTVFIDKDFLVDQVFWKHAAEFTDRLHTDEFLVKHYLRTAQVMHLEAKRTSYMMPWLDELVALSMDGQTQDSFFRMLSLLFAIFDVTAPFVAVSQRPTSSARPVAIRPTLPRHCQFHPLRAEALHANELLRGSIATRWTLKTLAEEVHLSASQLSRVFVDSFGKTPLAYLTMLRVKEFARLLRAGKLPVAEAAKQVGWSDPSYAARVFRQCVGMTPRGYRTMCHDRARWPTD